MYKLHSNVLHNKHITLLFYECVICFIYICRFSMKNNTILKASSSFCKQNNLSHIYSLSSNDELVICVLCVISNVRPMKNKEGNWAKMLRIRKSSSDDDDVAKYCHKKHFGDSIIPSSATDWFISFLIEHGRRKFTQRKKQEICWLGVWRQTRREREKHFFLSKQNYVLHAHGSFENKTKTVALIHPWVTHLIHLILIKLYFYSWIS